MPGGAISGSKWITNWSFTKIDIAVLVSVHEGQTKYVHVYILIELLQRVEATEGERRRLPTTQR